MSEGIPGRALGTVAESSGGVRGSRGSGAAAYSAGQTGGILVVGVQQQQQQQL